MKVFETVLAMGQVYKSSGVKKSCRGYYWIKMQAIGLLPPLSAEQGFRNPHRSFRWKEDEEKD